MRIAAILLAAGRSTRFGGADKLVASLAGRPLVRHAADTLGALRLASYHLVTADPALACPGYATVVNDAPAAGLSRSIALGVAAVRQVGAEAVLIALADMPLVPPAHVAALIAHGRATGEAVASTDGGSAMPPALFPAAWFGRLEALTGDRGARDLLARVATLRAPAGTLADVDRVDDLDAVERTLAGHDEPRA